MNQLSDLLVTEDTTIRKVMTRIDQGATGIALLVDRHRRLLATVTDGDIRRAILAGTSLDSPIGELASDPTKRRPKPLTAPAETPRSEQLRLMHEAKVRHLPLLDRTGRVVELVTADQDADAPLSLQAVIMAGGFGQRLRPLTDDTPKPMLPIAGSPLMERTIKSLSQVGVRRINVTTHYLPEKITDYFGSGSRYGVELNYVAENQPLGTAGALSLVGSTEDPLLVLNGDILTRVDYRALLKFHQQHGADMTVGVRQYELGVPYGVIEAEGGHVKGVEEKPKFQFLVSAGIYLLEPQVCRRIPAGERCDMPELIEKLLQDGATVVSFPVIEYWLDIGHHDDFRRAQEDVREMERAA
jgi:dTDP-glucose pyrophosphorylase